MAEINGQSALALLPKAPEVIKAEKLFHIGAFGLIGVGAYMVVPYLTKLMLMISKLMLSGIGMTIVASVLLLLVYALPKFVSVAKLQLDIWAEKATYSVIERDPVVPLVLWQREIDAEGEEFGEQLENLDEITSQIETKEQEARSKAQTAEGRARGIGESDPEFVSLAHEVDSYTKAADRLAGRVAEMKEMSDGLSEIYAVYKAKSRELKVDIDIQRTDWEASKVVGAAMDSAERLLLKGSERQRFAEHAALVITNKYAGEFGRLRSMKKLSKDVITAYRADQGAAAKKLLAKWNSEKETLVPRALPQNTSVTIDAGYENFFNK